MKTGTIVAGMGVDVLKNAFEKGRQIGLTNTTKELTLHRIKRRKTKQPRAAATYRAAKRNAMRNSK